MWLLFRLKGLCVRDVGSNPTLTSKDIIMTTKQCCLCKYYSNKMCYADKKSGRPIKEYISCWRAVPSKTLQNNTMTSSKISALTVEDLERLHFLIYAVKNNKHGAITFAKLSDEQYEEVIRRYNVAKQIQ